MGRIRAAVIPVAHNKNVRIVTLHEQIVKHWMSSTVGALSAEWVFHEDVGTDMTMWSNRSGDPMHLIDHDLGPNHRAGSLIRSLGDDTRDEPILGDVVITGMMVAGRVSDLKDDQVEMLKNIDEHHNDLDVERIQRETAETEMRNRMMRVTDSFNEEIKNLHHLI